MSDTPEEKVDSAEAWNEFCEVLKKAGQVLLREDLAPTLFDRAEGHRYLLRLLRAGSQVFGERTGPQHPIFRAMPALVKMGIDNPDNYYIGANVTADHTYRIRGTRGTIHYMSFAAQNQNFAAKDQISGGAGHLNDSDIELAADGSFEIIASQKEQPGNWLKMNPDTSMILLRQTFLDRGQETPVKVEIECLESEGPPPPMDASQVQGMLMGSAMYAIGCSAWFADWIRDMQDKAPVNQFHFPDIENHRRLGGDPNIRMWLGLWKLAPDEALVIEATPPNCHYWNFQLANIWAESLDYEFRRVHINNGDAVLRDDGSFQIVVAHEDPGHPNWIDTAGHHHGSMALRWVRTDAHPEPKTRVVKLSEVMAR